MDKDIKLGALIGMISRCIEELDFLDKTEFNYDIQKEKILDRYYQNLKDFLNEDTF